MNTTIEFETQQTREAERKIVMDVQNITKILPLGKEQIEILKGISFQILGGEFISIVGPSGSGKSTLLGIVAGLDNPTTGQVLIDSVDITHMTESRLAAVRNSKIGMVFQSFNLIPTLTAQENVEIPLYVGKHKGSPSVRAQELLALVGLAHRLNHRPNQLSGGEQQRVAIARALATMLALFIGVYGIGLIIGLGHDVLTQTSTVVNQNAPYNLVATASGNESNALQGSLSTIPGLTSHREDLFVSSVPRAIDGRPIQQVLGKNLQGEIGVLGGIEGYNLAQNVPSVKISGGRNLNPGDASSNNVLVSAMMTSSGWFNMGLKPGSTVTLSSADGKQLRTVTVVGIISIPTSYENLGDVLAPAPVVNALSAGSNAGTTVFYMKVPPAQVNQALDTLGRIAPHAAVQNLTDGATAFLQEFSRLLNMLVGIALLSVLAGVIIIANAVALAMLERRRELGILKSVGYTSGTVMREILLENGIIGGVSSFIAMLLASSAVAIGGKQFFQASFSVEPLVVVCLVVGPVILAMLTAALVSWRAVRVRPLEVLRYE